MKEIVPNAIGNASKQLATPLVVAMLIFAMSLGGPEIARADGKTAELRFELFPSTYGWSKAVGAPLLVTGAAGLAWGLATHCNEPNDEMLATTVVGATFGTIGLGLSAGGIVSLVRAAKAARRALEPKHQRRRRALAASSTAFASALVVEMVAYADLFECRFNSCRKCRQRKSVRPTRNDMLHKG